MQLKYDPSLDQRRRWEVVVIAVVVTVTVAVVVAVEVAVARQEQVCWH